MTRTTLLLRSLGYYWRTNLAVVLGVAVAVSVLAGALVVGQSVRASLRELALQRLGRTAYAVRSDRFFREALAREVAGDARVAAVVDGVAPLIALTGVTAHEPTGRRASGVSVYGVDARFWHLHGRDDLKGPEGARDVWLSEGLARELGAAPGDTVLLRVEKPTEIPLDSLHARKDDIGRTVRLRAARVLAARDLGEFSLRAQQSAVNALFVPLDRLQRDLERAGRVNALLLSAPEAAETGAGARALGDALRTHVALEDVELTLRSLPGRGALALDSGAGLLPDAVADQAAQVASSLDLQVAPVLTYLANTLTLAPDSSSPRRTGRPVPYSLVTATTLTDIAGGPIARTRAHPPIVLNDWTAREMGARVGDVLTAEYFVWTEAGALETRAAPFEIAAIVPIEGAAADADLAPRYPGISQADNVADWDPPFPIDLSRVEPADEAYWDRYRATPKAFISLEVGQSLWRSRHGRITSLRLRPTDRGTLERARDAFGARLASGLDPLVLGFSVQLARDEALAASQGATDFGEYFLYFSFFLLVSALLLAALLFRLGIEQRARELGVLQALGLSVAQVRALFLAEGLLLSAAGALVGAAGTLGYAGLVMYGLRTWWVDAVGTTALALRPSPAAMLLGVTGGLLASAACIWWTLRAAMRVSPRALLGGSWEHAPATGGPVARRRHPSPLTGAVAMAAAGLGLATLLLGAAGLISKTGGFFGAGTLFLIAALTAAAVQLRRPPRSSIAGSGWWPMSRLGFRYATYRPGRSVLCITLIASATFIIVAVEAFRRTGVEASRDPRSGTGGYALMAESALPLLHDPNTPGGRDALNLVAEQAALADVRFDRFRLRPGDDASCLNLYRPRNPRIVAPAAAFLRGGRFAFQSSIAETPAERENPWLLLERSLGGDVVPVIADANSLTYVLHLGLGDDFVLERTGLAPVRLRVVGALRDSVLQGELVMAEAAFTRLFPDIPGYRFFLIDAPAERAGAVLSALESRLEDYGVDVTSPAERLQAFHRVENTYLSTFQTLGALGLLLGTVGLAIVLWRNVLERRRDLALLRAVGYAPAHLTTLVVAENVLLLVAGLGAGLICAVLAILPAIAERGGQLPSWSVGVLIGAVLVAGLAASSVATITALRAPLLSALRSE